MSKVKPRTKLVAIHPVHGYAIPPPQDVKVSRRNARERNRVKTVNNGFEMLKRHIPTAAPVKKMSKVNILTQAVEYIESLQCPLKDGPTISTPSSQSSTKVSYSSPAQQSNYSSYSKQDHPQYHHNTPPSHCYPGHQASPYPSPAPPLTPISPNTMYYNQYHPPRSYESGYDSGDITDLDRKPSFNHHHEYSPHSSSFSRLSSPPVASSPPVTPNTHYAPPPPPLVPPNTSAQDNTNDSSGEEDDILDAIAEWQQH